MVQAVPTALEHYLQEVEGEKTHPSRGVGGGSYLPVDYVSLLDLIFAKIFGPILRFRLNFWSNFWGRFLTP